MTSRTEWFPLVNEEGETIQEEVPTYMAQGGFIGFEAASGEHDYILEYESPWFRIGLLFTTIGLLATLLSLHGFGILAKKEKFRQEELRRMHMIREKELRRLEFFYDDCEDR